MHRRGWDANTKAMMGIEGLKGKPVAALCHAHPIRQAHSYRWRGQCLAHAPQAFAVHAHSQRAARLGPEHARLKPRVGELTRACNQRDERRG
jgi:hypothetical protein